ncbi:hypothetical protein [Siphonobacter sp. BAB-5405]|uniref:hypothetical protein n=1 Tax=Siphonobacter sp. BAB-5405 TaxID=1864825 RepID=UPI0026AD7424
MRLHIEKIDTFAGHRDAIYALEAAPEPGQFFSSGSDGLVIRWDLADPIWANWSPASLPRYTP